MRGKRTNFLKSLTLWLPGFDPEPVSAPAAPPPAAGAVVKEAPARRAGRDAGLEARGRELAARLGCRELAASLTVWWSWRLTTTAGLAHADACRIVLNPRLEAVSAAEVERTFLHELAHLVARERNGRRRIKPHGPEWRRACAELGIPGESVRHNLPFERRHVARRFFYSCPACGKIIARARRLRRLSACAECCNRHNGGRFDRRFVLLPATPGAAPRACEL